MANADDPSNSAAASFKYENVSSQTNRRVADFVGVANVLLPFEYRIVERQVVARQEGSRNLRRQTVQEFANGCRDFT